MPPRELSSRVKGRNARAIWLGSIPGPASSTPIRVDCAPHDVRTSTGLPPYSMAFSIKLINARRSELTRTGLRTSLPSHTAEHSAIRVAGRDLLGKQSQIAVLDRLVRAPSRVDQELLGNSGNVVKILQHRLPSGTLLQFYQQTHPRDGRAQIVGYACQHGGTVLFEQLQSFDHVVVSLAQDPCLPGSLDRQLGESGQLPDTLQSQPQTLERPLYLPQQEHSSGKDHGKTNQQGEEKRIGTMRMRFTSTE